MPMRLLPKSELEKAKATARKMEIDEGVKLARRVDNLREVAAQEEVSLKRFRDVTLAKINEETTEARKERDELRAEVRGLKSDREELKKPLDKEWADIAKAHQALEKQSEEAHYRTLEAQKCEKEAKKAVKQASDALARAATREDSSLERLRTATEAERDAKLALKNAKKVEADTLKLKEAVEKELTHRDMEMAAKERGYTMRVAKLKEGEAALEKGWALLNDRKVSFEKRIKRSKT